MIDNEGGANIFDLLTDDLKQTTITEQNGPISVVRVDPEKVARLINALQEKGIKQIRYFNDIRILSPELAVKFAQAASIILTFTIGALTSRQTQLISARNWGSSITGFVIPTSDVDLQFDLSTVDNLKSAGQLLRHDQDFHNALWKLSTPVRVPSVAFSLSVPSVYKEERYPGEKWIPRAHSTIILKRP
ncbi:hypothetical protein HY214_02415 [Candidatus Roizmanbacteria bacterium]|nr:hypothetical protein [Candidatus Roizmanbacteria bacterium]